MNKKVFKVMFKDIIEFIKILTAIALVIGFFIILTGASIALGAMLIPEVSAKLKSQGLFMQIYCYGSLSLGCLIGITNFILRWYKSAKDRSSE